MRVTELRLGCAKNINLGNFQWIRVEASITIELSEGDDLNHARAEAQPILKALLEDTYRAQMKAGTETYPLWREATPRDGKTD